MAKKQYAIHGTAKGKRVFDVAPVAHVWADSPEAAEAQGRNIIDTNPIYNKHFDGSARAEEKK